jgi:hypothetical protein
MDQRICRRSSLHSPTYSVRTPHGLRAVRADSSVFTRTLLGIFLAESPAKFPFLVLVKSKLSLSLVRANMLGLGICPSSVRAQSELSPRIVINFLKRKFLSDDRASFLDLESICILLIASFLIEIIAKYP